MKLTTQKSFTLIELLIVISIIAVLAATIIPNFVGFDTEARVTATRTNLDTLRTRISLFRAKEGKYPESLQELLDTYYLDAGVKRAYLNKFPPEMLSTKSGNSEFVDAASSEEAVSGEGGWVYYADSANVHINLNQPLAKKWGEYEGQKPIDW